MGILTAWIALCLVAGAGVATPHISAHVRNQRALKRAGWL